MLVPLLVAAFHVPKTPLGLLGVPPNCQSWHLDGIGSAAVQMTSGSAVMSVMKSAGKIGRPEGSVADGSPICGLRTKSDTFPGSGVNGETENPGALTPSKRA